MEKMDKEQVVGVLNRLLEAELAGVVRYTHYSLLVFGFGRIPIVSWLRDQATESLTHAQQVGEWITTLGAYPSLTIGSLLDSHKHDIAAMLKESLDTEAAALALYRELLALVEGRSVALEEFARQMIYAEELHAADVEKMLRKP
jgi:bacterioferritin